jgi:KAP family P-loop domain
MTGYDAPAPRSEDVLGRWSFARRVYRIVEQTPDSWSVRIGVHGKWGDGKTTVLRFLKKLALKEHQIVLEFTPWSAKTRDELWREFLVTFAQGLQGQGITLGNSIVGRTVSGLLRYEDLARHLSKANRIAEATSLGFFHLLREMLEPSSAPFKAIKHQLGNRRIIILVDDLDRAEPNVLPFLFLALREIFDLPGFAFVLAFDDETVAKMLEDTRLIEGHGSSFLDKLLDFRLALPIMTLTQTQHFLLLLMERHLDFFDKASLNPVISLIAKNPRRIKRFVRHLAALQPALQRFDVGEIDYYILYLSQLVELESQALVHRLLMEMEESNMQLFSFKDEERQERRNQIVSLLASTHTQASEEYIVPIVEELLDNAFRFEASVATVRLVVLVPWVTLREANAVLEKWHQHHEGLSEVDEWVVQHSENFCLHREDVARELFEQLSKWRKRKLDEAAGVVAESNVNACVDIALGCLRLQNALFGAGLACVGDDFYRKSEFVKILAAPMLEWAHFRVNEADRRARDVERQVLSECLSCAIENPEDLLRWVQPWSAGSGSFEKEKRELLTACMPHIEEAVAVVLMRKFEERLGLQTLLGNDGICWRHILAVVEGPFWRRIDEIHMMFTRASEELIIHENCVRFFECICMAFSGRAWPLGPEHVKEVLDRHREFARDVWSAVIAQPIQFRMQGDIRQHRQQLMIAGIPDEELPLPSSWITPERYEELTGRPPAPD